MTYIKELPICKSRFGRTSMVEKGERLVPVCVIACGYRDVDAEECIICGGFTDTKLEFKTETFIRVTKGKKNIGNIGHTKVKENYHNGLCPDCGKPMPDDIKGGQECSNCGHVFY